MLNGNILQINLNNIKHNVRYIVKHYDYEYYIGVVKANAYGHGYNKVINAMEESGINYFAVSSLNEALEVRKFTNKGILILTPVFLNEIDECIKNNFSVTIDDIEYLKKIKNTSNLKIHIKLNTGMNRFGVNDIHEINEIIDYSTKNDIFVEGLYTHLYYASNDNIVNSQIETLTNIIESIDYKFKMIHVMNSEGLLTYPKIKYTNGIRIGDLLYGFTYNENFKSTISLKTNIVKIRELKKGDTLGYDASYTADSDTRVAIVPIGYESGIIKCNKGRTVYINNKEYEIIGNICMCCLFINIDNTVTLDDEVYIIKDSKHVMDISKYISKYYESAPSEITCIINKNITKEYL